MDYIYGSFIISDLMFWCVPGNNFLNMFPKAQATIAKITKWYCIKLKGFAYKWNNLESEEKAHEMGENIYTLYIW